MGWRVYEEKRERKFCKWCGERPAEHQIDNKDVFNHKWVERLCEECFTGKSYDYGSSGDDDRQTWIQSGGGAAVINQLDKDEQERLR